MGYGHQVEHNKMSVDYQFQSILQYLIQNKYNPITHFYFQILSAHVLIEFENKNEFWEDVYKRQH